MQAFLTILQLISIHPRKYRRSMSKLNERRRQVTSLTLALTVGLLGGCATLLSEDTQDVTITLSCQGKPLRASCTAENDRGSWKFTAPGSVTVKNSKSSLSISCKPQYKERFTVTAYPMPSLTMAANALLGGIIGAAVDVYNDTGLKYPENIEISGNSCN